ncbi:hypothetical protein OROGR_011448 [Orobanche gracilis]
MTTTEVKATETEYARHYPADQKQKQVTFRPPLDQTSVHRPH